MTARSALLAFVLRSKNSFHTGSYVVTRFKAEKDVTFDHGLDGSVAEDCYFSMIAYKKGYTFDFVEGMYRKVQVQN